MVASTVALLLVSGGFVTYELITRRQTMMHDLSTLAEVIGNESAPAVAFDDDTDRARKSWARSRQPHIVAAALYKDGHLFAIPDEPDGLAFSRSGLSRMVSPIRERSPGLSSQNYRQGRSDRRALSEIGLGRIPRAVSNATRPSYFCSCWRLLAVTHVLSSRCSKGSSPGQSSTWRRRRRPFRSKKIIPFARPNTAVR